MNPASPPATPAPLLSIVVLVYNTSAYLHECFDSLLHQAYRNIEVIAIDDASTDDSLAICREYEAAHPNFSCISKANEGGAIAGNLGISLARGEYVALVDSDDVVTPDGYRLMMEEALRTGADITIGRAARLVDGARSAAGFLYEPYVWSQRRTFDSVEQFDDVIHDCFYWNKVFRTGFLRAHGLGMDPGLLYADRPFVHRAYWHSRRTAIIPDLVYLWRTRPEGAAASISQSAQKAGNFADRIRSMVIEWHDFAGIPAAAAYRRKIAVANLHRALYAAPGIVSSPSFRRAFMQGIHELLALYGDLDWSSLGVRRCLYLELIRRNEVEGLCFLLGATPEGSGVTEIDGACYWQQPFLDNPEVPVPREVMRVDFPVIGFFHVGELALDDNGLGLDLHLHEGIMARCGIAFELQSLYGEGVHELVAEGRAGAHRWRYSLPPDRLPAAPGLYGLVMHYRAPDGTCGRYRVGWHVLMPEWRACLPMQGRGGRLELSSEAGGLALLVK